MPKRPRSVGLNQRLQDPKYVSLYLREALSESVEAFLVALGEVANSRNMTRLAQDTKLNRVHLYRMLSDSGVPEFRNIFSILKAVGIELHFNPVQSEEKTGISQRH